jgi:hypothetical protein
MRGLITLRLIMRLILTSDEIEMTMWPNKIAGAVAGRAPEFIEMMQVGVSRSSGSARLMGRST